MFQPTHDGVRVVLMDPEHAARLRAQRFKGWLVFLAALFAGVGFALYVPGSAGAITLLGGGGLGLGVVWLGRDQKQTLHINPHRVRVEKAGEVVRSIPIHHVTGVSTYVEQLVLHTEDGDVDLYMPGRYIEENSDVAILVEEQIERFKALHGDAQAPDSLHRLLGRETDG